MWTRNAQCKDFCARGYDTCNSANDSANNATCLSWYSSCVGAKDLPTLTSSCVSNSEASYLNGTSGDNAQDADLATCKSQCGYLYSTCLSSGDESVKEGCLSFYSECTSGTGNSTASSLNCVADVEQCYLDGTKSDSAVHEATRPAPALAIPVSLHSAALSTSHASDPLSLRSLRSTV
ncbi:hypothetical protein D6C83_06705 [Aureobasidium pullulans]|uniref:Uncharacterized protein n=1 Tax=Aureobasidium pullulans TaxID=5580 RepID=A0A4V4LEB3_AURPU|nr:hypothetical protein D6C83_06705 [Aureobasidium pullulans]